MRRRHQELIPSLFSTKFSRRLQRDNGEYRRYHLFGLFRGLFQPERQCSFHELRSILMTLQAIRRAGGWQALQRGYQANRLHWNR
jgi:hypothetical protein